MEDPMYHRIRPRDHFPEEEQEWAQDHRTAGISHLSEVTHGVCCNCCLQGQLKHQVKGVTLKGWGTSL